MNLLQANGHPWAMHYPIGRVWDESSWVVERENSKLATIGVIVQAATGTTGMTASKKAGENFSKLIKSLAGDN